MKLKALTGSALAIAMLSTSVAATAAPVANPASSLSLSSNVRAGSATTGKSKAAGGGVILAGLIAAGVAAIGVVAIVKDDNDDNSDSN